jgi:hypothetical protein
MWLGLQPPGFCRCYGAQCVALLVSFVVAFVLQIVVAAMAFVVAAVGVTSLGCESCV